MNDTARIAPYEMNPAEDYLLYGDELEDGMQVLLEEPGSRFLGDSEDARIRSQRFCTVTRLRRNGATVKFIGVYVDGFQKAFSEPEGFAWIVKREGIPSADAELREISEEHPDA